MAVYDSIPSEKPARKTKRTGAIPRLKTQAPGNPISGPRGLSESPAKNGAKTAKGVAKAVSNQLDTKNKGSKVAGNGSARDTLAQGAQKAGTPSPKPDGTDKKVRGQSKK